MQTTNEVGAKAPDTVRKEAKNVVQPVAHGTVLKQITSLYGLPVTALKERFLALFPDSNAPSSKEFLVRRIAHKLQEDAFGGLSAPAREKLKTLQTNLDPLKDLGQKSSSGKATGHIPLPGTIITKAYKGKTVEVKVLEKGFEYNGKPYRSLSRVAREVSGVHQSGFVFFGL